MRTLTEDLGRMPGHVVTSGNWKARAIVATLGNQSLLGTILIACLGRAPDHAPRIVSAAEIGEDGWVECFFQKRGEEGATMTRICHIDSLIGNFRGLADALKLSDADRTELFKELRAWAAKDRRAEPAYLGERSV